jgi:uncharacterized protein (TIGR03435 family)
MVVLTLLPTAYGQTPRDRAKTEFEAAAIRVNPPRTGFHFAADASTGGPGTSDPGMYHCTNCTLATLIAKAFDLRNYQFPARKSLADASFDVMARIPEGATQEEFLVMLRNLLKDRFGLQYHYTQTNLRGYHLVIAAKGGKLKESGDNERAPAAEDSKEHRQNGNAEQHRFGPSDAHTHTGPMVFNGSATFRRDHQTTADLARMLSDQLNLPVDDQTGLRGKYDIALTWAGDLSHSGSHAEGGWSGSHADHGGGPAAPAGSDAGPADASGPTLFEALQSQLGLKLVPSNQAAARVFVIDHVQPLPTEN